MSLKNILLDVSSVLALDITSTDERAYHIEKINEAAAELYFANDLPGCLREQIFQVDDSETYQVAFPWYVGKIRAMRFYNNWLGKISPETMKPRYHNTKWGNKGLIRGRVKGLGVPLSRDLQDISYLVFTLKDDQGEAEDVIFNVVGETENSSHVVEAVTIVAGQYTAQTTNNFKSIIKIEKTDYNDLDCVVTDLNGNEVSFIPNFLLQPFYTVVLIRDDEFAPLINNSFPLNTLEVLYKTAFVPFQDVYDEFPCPNCDKIIFWKFAENYYNYKPGSEGKAAVAKGKAQELINQLFANDSLGKSLLLEFGSNSMYDGYRKDFIYPQYRGMLSPLDIYTP